MIRCREVSDIESAYIRQHFSYDPDTGIITRDDRRNSNGCHNADGYLQLKIKKVKYLAHRLAWFLYYNECPESEMDHINRNRTDNRICNLRVVDRRTNVINSYVLPNPKTGVRGVYEDTYTKGLKKRYTTKMSGRTYRFYSVEDAIAFRKENNLPL